MLDLAQEHGAISDRGERKETHLAHSSPLPLSQAHLWPLGPHKLIRGLRAHAHLPDQVADDERGAAPTARLAVDIRELPALRMLCTWQVSYGRGLQ